MGTKNKKFPDIKGISVNSIFFDSLNPFDLFYYHGYPKICIWVQS